MAEQTEGSISCSRMPLHTQHKVLMRVVAVCGAVLALSMATPAQIEEATIQVLPESGVVRLEVSGAPRKSWSFRDTYAGVIGLGRRIKNFQAVDTPGARNSARELAPGQYELGASAARVSYEVDLTPPRHASDAAFVSWLTKERGLLMLGDLLPVTTKRPGSTLHPVFVSVETPSGWAALLNEDVAARRSAGFGAADDGVFIVGKSLRRSNRTISGKLFTALIDGSWAFADQDAIDTLSRIVQLHGELSPVPCAQVTLVLSTFPGGAGAGNTWSAETRGCNVTLLMGQMPSRVGALAQLGNALTHETFHLWIPNGVALSGDYDWFYEGFTMYQAARAAVRLEFISWPEFLNAIARAHDGSAAVATTQPLSLIDASKQRWTTGSASVYSKAMVAAFIYDLSLRSETGGKRSLDDVYRKIFREHSRRAPVKQAEADGNAVAMEALRTELSSPDFVNRFVSAPVSIDLAKELAPFGLRVEKMVRTHISVSDNITKRQRDLLKQLGYNEPRSRNRLR